MMASDQLSWRARLRGLALSMLAGLMCHCQLDSRVSPEVQAQTESAGKPSVNIPDARPYDRFDNDAGDDEDAGRGSGADACELDHGGCDALVSCHSVQGRAKCGACPAGYDDVHGDGTVCRDSDECATGTDDCSRSPRACLNTLGSFECKCPTGYSGNGHGATGCLDRDECADDSDDCTGTPDACVNDAPGFHCQCPKGFTGNGQGADGCRDADECATNSHDCAVPEACVNDTPGFHCTCPAGYRGDGHGPMGCIDIDECALGTSGCDAPRTCINDPGSSHCGPCPAGYQPNGLTGCTACACYERSAEELCSSTRESEPAAATRVLAKGRKLDEGSLSGIQVTLPDHAHVTGFGTIKNGDETPRVAFGLYTDVTGAPGSLVARSVARAFSNQRITLPVQEDLGCLSAGTYWLLALVSDDGLTLGAASDGEQLPFAHAKLEDGPGLELPARWPADGKVNKTRLLNMYVSFDQP